MTKEAENNSKTKGKKKREREEKKKRKQRGETGVRKLGTNYRKTTKNKTMIKEERGKTEEYQLF